jgi:hypothetical protein
MLERTLQFFPISCYLSTILQDDALYLTVIFAVEKIVFHIQWLKPLPGKDERFCLLENVQIGSTANLFSCFHRTVVLPWL